MTTNGYELAMLLLAGLGCAVLVGCRPAAGPLAVVLSGDTAGWIAPCGCASNQSGGLARRATYLGQVRGQSAVIAADVGGAVRGTSPYDRVKLEAILRGEALMGVAAHNIGAAEARFSPDFLRKLSAGNGVPLVSANVRDRRDGRLVAEPLRIVTAAGRCVALVGVLSQRYATPELDVAPPREAVLDALRAAAGRYDAAIVLAYLPEDELRQLAEDLPEADVVAGGPTGQPIAPHQLGPTLLVSATNMGKFVVRLDAPTAAVSDRWKGSVVELDGRLADDPALVANLARFREALGRADFTPEQSFVDEGVTGDPPQGFAVAGTAACRKCHEEDGLRWADSQHAKAWKSLADKGAEVDPNCQRCHTTGYGLPTGFVSARRSGDRHDVGCEECHGPSLAHTTEPTVRTAYFAQARDHCTTCHDHENSPQFAYKTYWKKIVHGKKIEKGKKP
jgi:hypothetical protein